MKTEFVESVVLSDEVDWKEIKEPKIFIFHFWGYN